MLDFDKVLALLGRVAITFSDRLAILHFNGMDVCFLECPHWLMEIFP
jgi:hypothetical protein